MVEEAVEAMVEEVAALVVAMVEASVAAAISVAAVAISLGLPGIVLPAIASENTKERTLRAEIISGAEIISVTTEISFLEIPLDTEIPIRMIIRTTAIMITMTATIPMGNTHKPT
jgi:hypothetical protein